MRGDAVFGDIVHQRGAHLHFDALAAGADDGRVHRAVIVLLRRRDIILETAGHGRPFGMDDADDAVAILDRLHDDAKAENIGELLEGDRIALHLAEHRIGRLFAPLTSASMPRARSSSASSFSIRLMILPFLARKSASRATIIARASGIR